MPATTKLQDSHTPKQLAVREGLRLLAPNGTRQDIIAALGRPITWGAIQHWMEGRKPMPPWAIDRICEHIARLQQTIRATAAIEPRGDRGRRHWRAYWAAKARERDEQARKEKGAL